MHILSTTKPKLKAKWQPAHGSVILLAMKPRINEGSGMEPESLLEEMLYSMSLSSIIRTEQAQNEWREVLLLAL